MWAWRALACVGGVEGVRQKGMMVEEGTKREGTELLGLPPRKRFKVMEQQRRKEIQEEAPGVVDSHCDDITNVLPLHRVSPKKLTSQGFLVLEKQKYRLKQQKLPENLVPALPSLPPRPVALKRKEAPTLPLPVPPNMRLKFEWEKVHSPSSSMFKSWGSPFPKKINKSEASPVVTKSSGSPREARKDPGHRPKRHQQESLRTPSSVEHSNTWTMAKGTTCSINKAQEDVELMVCEALVSSSDICSSDEDVIVSTSTTSSAPTETLDLNAVAEVDNSIEVAGYDNIVEASHVVEVETMTVMVPFVPMGDHVKDITADHGSSVPFDDIHVGDSHALLMSTTTDTEAAYVHVEQAKGNQETVVDTQQMDGPSLETPFGQMGLSEDVESRMDVCETFVGIREVEEEPEGDAHKAREPEAQLMSSRATGYSVVALFESHVDSETSNISKALKDLAVAVVEKESSLSNPFDKANDEEAAKAVADDKPAAKVVANDEQATKVMTQATKVVTDEEQATKVVEDEVKVGGDKETVAAATLKDTVAVTEKRNEQDMLLAEIDERAEKVFKRMFEKEGYTGCDDDEDGSDPTSSQFFFASNGVNNFVSLVTGMEVKGGTTSDSQDLDTALNPEPKNSDDQVVDASSLNKDHRIDLGRPTVHVPNKPPEEMTSEMPESSSRASEGHNGSVCSEDQESDSPIPAHESIRSHGIVCKSSKEDSDWDLEMEIPNFGFGKRSGGITQRVKAPGRWSQGSETNATNLDEEGGEDDDEGACDVCRSADAKPSDPIVYCDGCDIPVHADCYGNPLSHGIPEGDWFCDQCQSKRPDSRSCSLCPRSGGVMKMTTDGNWAHLSCAVFVPEVTIAILLDTFIFCFNSGVSVAISSGCSVCVFFVFSFIPS